MAVACPALLLELEGQLWNEIMLYLTLEDIMTLKKVNKNIYKRVQNHFKSYLLKTKHLCIRSNFTSTVNRFSIEYGAQKETNCQLFDFLTATHNIDHYLVDTNNSVTYDLHSYDAMKETFKHVLIETLIFTSRKSLFLRNSTDHHQDDNNLTEKELINNFIAALKELYPIMKIKNLIIKNHDFRLLPESFNLFKNTITSLTRNISIKYCLCLHHDISSCDFIEHLKKNIQPGWILVITNHIYERANSGRPHHITNGVWIVNLHGWTNDVVNEMFDISFTEYFPSICRLTGMWINLRKMGSFIRNFIEEEEEAISKQSSHIVIHLNKCQYYDDDTEHGINTPIVMTLIDVGEKISKHSSLSFRIEETTGRR